MMLKWQPTTPMRIPMIGMQEQWYRILREDFRFTGLSGEVIRGGFVFDLREIKRGIFLRPSEPITCRQGLPVTIIMQPSIVR